MPDLRRRRIPGQGLSRSHEQLHLDQVEARRRLGHRVLHLQPGVDLHEREGALLRLVEVLHRAGAAVPGGTHQRGGRLAQRTQLLVVQDR